MEIISCSIYKINFPGVLSKPGFVVSRISFHAIFHLILRKINGTFSSVSNYPLFIIFQFTHEKGHIFVSAHLAEEVRFALDVKDEVLSRSVGALQNDLYASFDTLSGCRVVDRWRSWENFEKLGGTVEEAGKVKLLVTVEDTGTGIPPEAQGRIFTPFMQADSSTSRKYGGTGIGLSISKRLVHLMGGEIGFVSELNTGSTFTFSVTFNQMEANSADRMWQPCDLAVSEFHGLRALVIDDKRIRAEVTKYHIQRLGMNVDITCSMESACSYLTYSHNNRFYSSLLFLYILQCS